MVKIDIPFTFAVHYSSPNAFPTMTSKKLLFFALLCSTILWYACEKDPSDPIQTEPEPNSSWELIQQKIFEPNCVSCHTAGTSFAKQSDLILTADIGYEQLIGRSPKNGAAAADNLVLLNTDGVAGLAWSFLWEKIDAPNQAHFYDDHPEYGSIMPLGLPALTNGELEYIRRWINEGAPKEGFVVDEAVLENTDRYEPPTEAFQSMTPPSSGYQFHLGPFDVVPDYERELFYYEPLNNAEDIYISKVEINMRQGTHHFILYTYPPNYPDPQPNVIRDVRDTDGKYDYTVLQQMNDQIFVFGTQVPFTDYDFPEGVGLRVPANSGFDLNSHYVNRGTDTFQGEIYVNVHTVERSEITHVAENLFLSNEDLLLPPQKTTTVESTYTFDEKRYIFQLWSHAHEHLEDFKIYISGGDRDGELIYYTNDWSHPPLLKMDPPLELEAGQGLRGEATYNNDTNRTLRFGLLSEDEMMIIFGAYYTD